MEVTGTPGKWLPPPPCLGETISQGTGDRKREQEVIPVQRVGDSSGHSGVRSLLPSVP